ncbi:MAG: ferritin family protein [Dehalococcoidales bacterium]|nr:ferritin family protein [Dehalococcoidales bacterium]
MPTEQEKTEQALRYAIQMEIDGKAFYLAASRESGNELGKKLLESLANQEDYHRQKFEQIYKNIRKAKSWLPVEFKPDGGKTPRTIFARELENAASPAKGTQSEIDSVQLAMQLEDKSYDFYHHRSEQISPGAEKDFYTTIAGEEREHKLILLDYYEFLKDPASWYVQTEHPSLDGGN